MIRSSVVGGFPLAEFQLQMTHSDPSDEELMCSLRNGDDLALNSLMERWQKPSMAYSLRYDKNHSDASELVQETFVHLYLQRANSIGKGSGQSAMFLTDDGCSEVPVSRW
jgi:hypothetical protein